jgi:hypothetical protein
MLRSRRLMLASAAMGGSSGPVYLLRDMFTIASAAPLTSPRASTPGPGIDTISDVEESFLIAAGRLRGGMQATSAVWGEAKHVWGAISRAAGRTLMGLISPQDQYCDFSFGFATATNIGDQTTDGYCWVLQDGELEVAAVGVNAFISSDLESIRAQQYLCAVVLNDVGAAVLLSTFDTSDGLGMADPVGIPKYPIARVIYVCNSGTAATLYPTYSCLDAPGDIANYSKQALEDVRVLDPVAWAGINDPLAVFTDRFTRADSNTALGNDWVADSGTWGISSNAAYIVGTDGFQAAYHEIADSSDGIFLWDITVPADWNGSNHHWGGLFRRVSAGNYMVWWNNASNALYVSIMIDGVGAGSIIAGGYTWTAGSSYRIAIYAKGNQYYVFVNDVAFTTTWVTDAGSNHLAGTGIGLRTVNEAGGTLRWDNVAFYPHTVTLPAECQVGAVPSVLAAGSTLANDVFTDADATALAAHVPTLGSAWVIADGTWTIQSNRAACAAGLGTDTFYATQNIGAPNAECEVEITVPGAWGDANEIVHTGIIKMLDANNYVVVRLVRHILQATNDEIEIIENIAGAGTVRRKVQFGYQVFTLNSSYTLKVQFYGDLLLVWLDDHPCLSYLTETALAAGTKFGLFQSGDDSGCVFDNWSVKALPLSP